MPVHTLAGGKYGHSITWIISVNFQNSLTKLSNTYLKYLYKQFRAIELRKHIEIIARNEGDSVERYHNFFVCKNWCSFIKIFEGIYIDN